MVKIEDEDNFGWNSDDDLEIESYQTASNSHLMVPVMGTVSNASEASSSTSFRSEFFQHFVGMGFSDKLVAKAIEENGEEKSELILETLLTYSALENSPEAVDASPQERNTLPQGLDSSPEDNEQPDVDSDFWSDYNENISDSDSCWSGDEENGGPLSGGPLSDRDKLLKSLSSMGYTVEEASIAMDRCGPDASILELTDFISAAQLSKAQDAFFPEEEKPRRNLFCEIGQKKRKLIEKDLKKKRQRAFDEADMIRIPKPMIGFGVPGESSPLFRRNLPEAAIGPPFFYYENVALAPKGVWDTIRRFLYDIEPEFVDSKFFSAAARKRAYVHNLPLDNRRPLLPLAARTIHEALPMTRKWWPSWDPRTKLNCLQTCIASARLTDRIRKALGEWEDEPPLDVQKNILYECRKWNLVWVGKNKLAPLECDEVEMLLGFPKNHTRGGGISRTDRYKSLGNSFQVDTVAYHLSVLKDLYPRGLNVLSLFSGIGGAEVALHRLGIPLRTVVSVEKSEVNRNIVRDFWEQTNQTGTLIDFEDVQQLHGDKLEQIINSIGGFDLVIGGSPCNNLAGSNRHHRDGLEGKESALFYDYFRILDIVKSIMAKNRYSQ